MNDTKLIGRIIGILYRQSTTYFQNEFKPFGLGHSQGKVLRFIDIHEKVLPKQIAEYYNLDKGSVTSLIKGLEKNKFVIRESHPTDKRCFYLSLSAKSKKIIPELNLIFQNWSSLLMSNFSEEEEKQLMVSLQKMTDNTSSQDPRIT
ncbi:MAG: MarR family transcriptional regulator [Flavobacteriales bacterium]|nr:MarR family transcriptional regulator [Flavobacteriales bacterium]